MANTVNRSSSFTQDADSFWDELARRLDESYEDAEHAKDGGAVDGTGEEEETPNMVMMRTRSHLQHRVCQNSLAFLNGTHPRLGRNSIVTWLKDEEKVLQRICAYVAKDEQSEYRAYLACGKRGNINAYQFEQRIGEGTYGKVYRGVHKRTGFVVAIKALDKGRIKEQRMTEKVNRETNILQLLSDTGNPHVVRLFEFIETESKFYMVMTYCPGGDFFDFLSYRGHVTENEARALFLQILSGVEFCHQHHVVHRDLKPENLLIDAECNVKIADFSLANRVESIGSKDDQFFKPLHTSCGSPNYAAPEIVSGVEYSGFEVDIWSMGVILYSLICGMLPFDDDNPVILFRQIKSGKYPPPPAHVSRDCQQLLAAMMAVDPKKRCSIRQIRQNPWCLSEDFVCNKTIFAYAPLQPPEETLSEDSDEEIGRFLRSSKDKVSASGNSLNKSGSIGELADDPADYANKPGEISLYYKSQWTKTFLHHTIKGVDSWMPLPGERMKIPSEGDAIPELSGKEWRFLTVHRDKWGHAGITFAFNDGSGKWDNNGSPFKNYHADLPGTYWIDSATGEVVDVKTRLPVPGVG